MLMSEAIKGFFLHKSADGLSQNTIITYGWALRKWLMFTGDKEMSELSPKDSYAFFAYLPTVTSARGIPLSHKSLDDIWIALRSFDTWAAKELGISYFAHSVRRPQGELKQPKPFTGEEVKALLKAAIYSRMAQTNRRQSFAMKRPTALRDTALVLLLLDTGLRAGEAGRLRVEDVDLESGEVVVKPFGTGRKTKARIVYLGKASRRSLWKYMTSRQPEPTDCLFESIEHKPMGNNTILKLIVALGKRAHVDDCHPHRFRHTFAIQFLRNGGDVFTLQRILGHSSLDMVQHYVALADSDTASAHRRASPVDRWQL
jgi:integrase/recombinase XerD